VEFIAPMAKSAALHPDATPDTGIAEISEPTHRHSVNVHDFHQD
jgi:hypothetical protein